MFKLLRIALFALPLAGGAALAQGSGTSGSAGVPGSVMPPPVTNDTRTPTQEKAGRIDDTSPALPGDATRPAEPPTGAQPTNRNGMPDTTDMTTPGSQSTDKKVHKSNGATERQRDRDTTRDQLDSDK